MANAHLEITGALIRVGPDDWKYGDPGFWFGIDVVGDEGAAILKGLAYPGFNREHAAAIRAALLGAGFTHYARWRHREGDGARFVRVRL